MARVYSTDQGRLCPGCHRPVAQCVCKTPAKANGDGIVRLQRQTKGRNGKPVVIISGLSLNKPELKKLVKQLKSKCGVGGAIDDDDILIQGDKRDVLKQELEAMGYQVKLAGG
ncbi:MAG TPA: stress response translation initiation inhibitor YciH [Gammaproteobacteria bacterium]|nr:stress response translation initiation inhibitor YciH [Gammaproteobacteria bacterium]